MIETIFYSLIIMIILIRILKIDLILWNALKIFFLKMKKRKLERLEEEEERKLRQEEYARERSLKLIEERKRMCDKIKEIESKKPRQISRCTCQNNDSNYDINDQTKSDSSSYESRNDNIFDSYIFFSDN